MKTSWLSTYPMFAIKVLNGLGLLAVAGKVDVGIGAAHGFLKVAKFGTVHLKSQGADNPQQHSRFVAGLDDSLQFVLELIALGAALCRPSQLTVVIHCSVVSLFGCHQLDNLVLIQKRPINVSGPLKYAGSGRCDGPQ